MDAGARDRTGLQANLAVCRFAFFFSCCVSLAQRRAADQAGSVADRPQLRRSLQQRGGQRMHPLHGHPGARPGDADDRKGLLAAEYGCGHGRHARGKHLVDHGVAPHAGCMQETQQRLHRGGGLRAIVPGLAKALAGDQPQCALIAHGEQPGVARSRTRQPGMGAHVGVVAQALARALRLGHPGQMLAVHQRQAHQLTRLVGQALQQRLGDVHGACAAEVAQSERRKFGGQQIVAPHMRLAHVAPGLQIGQQAVAGAQGHVQLAGQQGQRNPVRVGGQVFQQGQATVERQAHRVSMGSMCYIEKNFPA